MNEELQASLDKIDTAVQELKRHQAARLEEVEKKTEKRMDSIEAMLGKMRLAPRVATESKSFMLGDDERKSLERFARTGAPFETKGLSVGSDPDGGWTVPEALDRMIGRVETDASPMRQVATVISVDNEEYHRLMSEGGAAAGWVGETEDRTETDTPDLKKIAPSFGEVYAFPFTTQKLLDDSAIDIAAWISEEVGITFAAKEGAAFISGDGIKKPRGLLTYPIVASPTFGQLKQIKSGSNGALSADKLIEVSLSLKARYLPNARWMMSRATLLLVRQLKNPTTSDYLWRPGIEAGSPATVLGYPVVLNEDMPAPGTGSHSIVFGDIARAYKIADVRQTRILRDPYSKKGWVGFYTTKRLGAGLEDSTAIVVHTLGA